MVPPASGGTLAQCHSGQYLDLVCQVSDETRSLYIIPLMKLL